MTGLTILTVAVVVYGVTSRRGYGPALGLGGATPAGAALVVGAIAVPTFYAVATGALAGVFLRQLRMMGGASGRRRDEPVPASGALMLFVLVAVLVTVAAPMFFDGVETVGTYGDAGHLTAGVLTKSNVAQIVYLVLGVGVVAYLARARWAGAEIVGTAAGAVVLLSLWSHLHTVAGLPFPEGLFDSSPSFAFIETLPGGGLRVRGILSEPAALAVSCLVMIAYGCSRLWYVSGLRRIGLFIVVATAAYLGSISTSTTFVAAGLVLTVVAGFVTALTFVLRGSRLSHLRVAALGLCGVAAVWVLPILADTVGRQVAEKLGSSSYIDRSSSDGESYRVLLETFGLGAGLGANRGSSFLTTLLSTVGVIGAVLFATIVVVVVRRSWSIPRVRPVMWALVALLVCKVVSGPDLSDGSGILWMSLGVLAHAALQARSKPVDEPDEQPSTGIRAVPTVGRRTGPVGDVAPGGA